MGNSLGPLSSYVVEVPNSKTDNCTSVYRAASHPDEIVENLTHAPLNNGWDLLECGHKGRESKNAIGQRLRHETTGILSTKYTWLTYKEFREQSLRLGTNLLHFMGDCLTLQEYPSETYGPAQKLVPLGLFSRNRIEWFITEYAASAYNWTLVPLYDSLNHEGLLLILKQTKMKVMLCSLEVLPSILKVAAEVKILSKVVVFTDPNESVSAEMHKQAKDCGLSLYQYKEVMLRRPDQYEPICPGNLDSIHTICYTSGTTGHPKGVLLTIRNVIACVVGLVRGPVRDFLFLDQNDSAISYLPLAHVLEHLVSCFIIYMGGSIGCYSGDHSLLLEDIQILEPTVFVSVPRLFSRINDAVMRSVSEKTAISRYLFARGKSTKINRGRSNAGTTDRIWDPLVFNKVKKMMGQKLRYMISGGAPLDPSVQENIQALFCVPVMEGYGMTETFGPAFLASSKDPLAGQVGGVLPCVEYKLKSEPELDYYVTDPQPRGQLLMRGSSVSVGYFLDKSATELVFDKDGWFYSGDVAQLLPNGRLKIIDRVKNIFKLSQGEYISAEKVENIYAQCPLISQIFVTGISTKQFLVAIVVPDEDALRSWSKKNGLTDQSSGFMKSLETAISQQMDEMAKQKDLKGFEKVKRLHVEPDPFTVENGLLTPTMKIRRHVTQTKYQNVITNLYEQ